jgi:hypothetical protein
MIEALSVIGGSGTLVGLVAVIVLAFKLVASAREQIALRDLLDSEREQHRATRGELDTETAAHQATAKALAVEKQLRTSVEVQRNDAYRRARDFYVERLKASSVADAVRLVDDLLSLPLPGIVPVEEVPAGDPATTEDDLLKPPGL